MSPPLFHCPSVSYRWDQWSKVRELSKELLLLHDHASSLRDIIHSAGLASFSSLEGIPTPGGGATNPNPTITTTARNPTNTSSPQSHSLPLPGGLLLQSASLPHLSRLLEARGAASTFSSHNLDVRHGLPHSRSEAFITQDSSNGSGDDDRRLRPGQTTRHPRASARPRSAGVARRWTEGNCCPPSASGLALEAGAGLDPVPAARTGNNAATESRSVQRSGGRIRPVSAPGRRPLTVGGKSRVGNTFTRPEEGNTGGGERQAATVRAQRMLFGGWSAQDVLDRNAGGLSRRELVCLVRALRQTLRGGDGVINQEDVPQPAQEVRNTGAVVPGTIHAVLSLACSGLKDYLSHPIRVQEGYR